MFGDDGGENVAADRTGECAMAVLLPSDLISEKAVVEDIDSESSAMGMEMKRSQVTLLRCCLLPVSVATPRHARSPRLGTRRLIVLSQVEN